MKGLAVAGGVGLEDHADFIADAAEGLDFCFAGADGFGWVLKAPVIAGDFAGKCGACLIGISADGDDGLDVLVEKLLEVLGGVAGDIDADFRECGDGGGVDVAGGV